MSKAAAALLCALWNPWGLFAYGSFELLSNLALGKLATITEEEK